MNRREVLTAATIASGSIATTGLRTDVGSFGATGDGNRDDVDAIQAALDHVGQRGGGTAFLTPPKVHYRISRGLRLPSNVILEGPAPVQYPFNAGNMGACALVADFEDPYQWVVEAATRSGSQYFPYNRLLDTLPDKFPYNCGIKNLLITSRGKIPFGGVRMHGCPGSIVEGVSIDRVGCGLLVNYSFGGKYKAQVHSLYYGVAAWDDANANIFEVYCTHSTPWPKSVPSDFRLPFMRQMEGHFSDTLKLSNDDHAARPYGVLCGSIRSTSISNVFDIIVERYPGGIFMFNAYGTDFRRCYLEADAGVMACGIAATRSRFSMQALHAYLSGTGAIFDFGIEVLGKIFASGILDAATFGKAPEDNNASLLMLEGIDPSFPGAPLQPGLRYIGRELAWLPLSLLSGWRPAPGYGVPAVRFDPWSHRVELRGAMVGGKQGPCFTLPDTCLPPHRQRHLASGGRVEIALDGTALILPEIDLISLDGISFGRW